MRENILILVRTGLVYETEFEAYLRCMYVDMFARAYAYLMESAHASCQCMYACIYVYMYAHAYVYLMESAHARCQCMYACIYVYMYAHAYVYLMESAHARCHYMLQGDAWRLGYVAQEQLHCMYV